MASRKSARRRTREAYAAARTTPSRYRRRRRLPGPGSPKPAKHPVAPRWTATSAPRHRWRSPTPWTIHRLLRAIPSVAGTAAKRRRAGNRTPQAGRRSRRPSASRRPSRGGGATVRSRRPASGAHRGPPGTAAHRRTAERRRRNSFGAAVAARAVRPGWRSSSPHRLRDRVPPLGGIGCDRGWGNAAPVDLLAGDEGAERVAHTVDSYVRPCDRRPHTAEGALGFPRAERILRTDHQRADEPHRQQPGPPIACRTGGVTHASCDAPGRGDTLGHERTVERGLEVAEVLQERTGLVELALDRPVGDLEDEPHLVIVARQLRHRRPRLGL